MNTGSLVANFQNGQRRIIDKDQFIQRINFVESSRSSWFGRYSWGDELQLQEELKLNGSKLLTGVKQAMLSNTRVFSSSMVNEFRFGYNKFANSTARELAFVRDVLGELKLPGLPPPPVGWGIPDVGITGFSGFGDNSEGPYVNNNHTFQWVDNLSWTRGKHSLRFGSEIRRDRYNQIGNQNIRGGLGFGGLATQNVHLPYVDATPNVADLNRHPTLVRIGSGDFYEGTLLRFNPAIKVARDGRLGERLVEADRNDFAPRLGIAWSPTSNWTLRTGAGVFYSQDTGNPRFDMSRNLAGRRNDVSNTDFPDLTLDRPFRNLGSTMQINTPAALSNNHHRRTPYTIQFLFNIQRELDRQTLLEVGYLDSVSRKLESYRDYNIPQPSPNGSVASRQPYPEFSRVWEVDGHNKANYHSLGIKAQRRFSQGFTYLLGYTWSKSIDTGSAIRNHDGDTLFPMNSFCMQCERALSSFHVAHRFVTSALYELPIGKGKRFLTRGGVSDALVGGWQISSILTLQTGLPLTVSSGFDVSNTATGPDRPNATGQQAALPRGQQDPRRCGDSRYCAPRLRPV